MVGAGLVVHDVDPVLQLLLLQPEVLQGSSHQLRVQKVVFARRGALLVVALKHFACGIISENHEREYFVIVSSTTVTK